MQQSHKNKPRACYHQAALNQKSLFQQHDASLFFFNGCWKGEELDGYQKEKAPKTSIPIGLHVPINIFSINPEPENSPKLGM